MPVDFTLSADRRTLRVRVDGAFTFAQARECIAALRGSGGGTLALDSLRFALDELTTMNSAALGTMLYLKERTGARCAEIVLSGCSGQVRDVLAAASLERSFEIQEQRR